MSGKKFLSHHHRIEPTSNILSFPTYCIQANKCVKRITFRLWYALHEINAQTTMCVIYISILIDLFRLWSVRVLRSFSLE